MQVILFAVVLTAYATPGRLWGSELLLGGESVPPPFPVILDIIRNCGQLFENFSDKISNGEKPSDAWINIQEILEKLWHKIEKSNEPNKTLIKTLKPIIDGLVLSINILLSYSPTPTISTTKTTMMPPPMCTCECKDYVGKISQIIGQLSIATNNQTNQCNMTMMMP